MLGHIHWVCLMDHFGPNNNIGETNGEILNSVKDIKDAKETIKNLLEIIDDMKSQSQPERVN